MPKKCGTCHRDLPKGAFVNKGNNKKGKKTCILFPVRLELQLSGPFSLSGEYHGVEAPAGFIELRPQLLNLSILARKQ